MNPLLTALQSVASPFAGELVAFLLTLLGGLILWVFRPKVKLNWGRSNNSIHFLPADDKKVEIYTEKFYIQNVGRKSASNVEFVLDGQPDDISVWQPRKYSVEKNIDGQLVLEIPFIAPGELAIVDVVYINKRAAAVVSVKSPDALAKQVPFVTQRSFGTAFNLVAAILVFCGVAFIVRVLGIAVLGI